MSRRLLSLSPRAAAGAAALLLAGCASMAPPHERPAAPVAAAFPHAAQPDAPGATPAADLPWQRFFGDARLQRLIALALENNRDLRIAALNVEQARAQFDIRSADRWPTVGLGVTGSRQPTGTGRINSVYTAGLAVTAWELDLFGRIRSLSDAALAQYFATDEARKAAQIALVAAVANAHLALQADDELLRVTQATLDTRAESQRLTRLRFDNGAASQIDLAQADSLLAAARATLAQATRQRALDEDLMVLLVGQPLPADLPPPLPLTAPLAFPALPVGLPSEVLVRRPDVRQAEQQLAAASANIGAARAAFFPRITLTGSVGSASTELSGLFGSGSGAWSFAPQLLQPVFDAGRNRANLASAEAAQRIAVAQYERAIQSAFREVADALAGRATLGEQLAALQAQVAAESDRFRLSDLRYRNGASSYLEVLDAQRSLFAAQQSLLQVQALHAQNQVALYRALGGGWTDEAPPR